MYVMRVEWQVKPGRMQEAVAVLKRIKTTPRFPRRIYSSNWGQFWKISWDFEVESMDEWQTINKEFAASPEGAEFWKTWNELVVAGSGQTWVPVDL